MNRRCLTRNAPRARASGAFPFLSRGFSLIELMIAVAIIGILAATALPAYLAYVPRTQVSEALEFLGAARTAVTEQRANTGAWPTSLADLLQSTSGKYTSAVAILDEGAPATAPTLSLVATMSVLGTASEIRGGTLVLVTADGGTTWTCRAGGARPIANDFLPASCR